MTTRTWLFTWVLAGLVVSCASKDFREPEIHSGTDRSFGKTYQRSYSNVWDAAITAFQEKKYPLAQSKRDGGLIVTDWVSGKSDRLFSGYGDTRIPYTIRFRMTVKLAPSREGVKLVLKNEEQYYSDSITAGTDFNGSLYQWYPTQSSGSKESALLTEIADQLATTATPKDKK